MLALCFALVVALCGLVGVLVWLIRRGDKRVDQTLNASDVLSKMREERDAVELDRERVKFELAQTKAALEAEKGICDGLENYVASLAQDTDPNSDLAPDDVAGRVLRFARRQRQAVPSTGSPVPAVPAS